MSKDFDNGISVGEIIWYIVLFLVVGMMLGWLVQGNDFFMYKFWAPNQEAVRRQVFEQTRSFNQGMIQELQNMQFQYVQADDTHKTALADLILHRAAGYNLNNPEVPADLRMFIQKLKDERMGAR
jgi:hypothetical protein